MGTPHRKIIWQCVAATKHGKKFCPHCKGIEERLIEGAFVESYNKVCYNNADVIDELLGRLEKSLSKNSFTKEIARLEKDIEVLVQKRTKLVDLHLEDSINTETYEKNITTLKLK